MTKKSFVLRMDASILLSTVLWSRKSRMENSGDVSSILRTECETVQMRQVNVSVLPEWTAGAELWFGFEKEKPNLFDHNFSSRSSWLWTAKSLFSSNFIHESILRKAKSHLFSAEAPLFRNFSLFSKVPLNCYYYWEKKLESKVEQLYSMIDWFGSESQFATALLHEGIL